MFKHIDYKVRDEYYTQEKDVEILVPFLKPGAKVWCPFDKAESNYVKVLRKHGFIVEHTHIDDGGDFFVEIEKERDCDYIISNPPYSLKTPIFEVLFKKGKPFAMFCHEQGMFEGPRFKIFSNYEFEILWPRWRAKFDSPYFSKSTSPPFHTNYYCHKVLPKQLIFIRG